MTAMEDLVSIPEAARQLGITTEEAYDLVFGRQLRSVESESGRRLVSDEAISEWRKQYHAAGGVPGRRALRCRGHHRWPAW